MYLICMTSINHFDKIKKILLTPPTFVTKLPFKVNDYTEAIKLWSNYKKYKTLLINDVRVKGVFDFHLSKCDHVIMYYSNKMDNCLLLCKINNLYYNIITPFERNDIIKHCDNSVLATYINAY